MIYQQGDIFQDKNTLKLYVFDGKNWHEIKP
jgi:hypothetical protein